MPLRMGYVRASRGLRGDGLGTAGFGKLGKAQGAPEQRLIGGHLDKR
jgi:hypothetical protein